MDAVTPVPRSRKRRAAPARVDEEVPAGKAARVAHHTPPVMCSAGAEETSFTGTWVLDKARSESMVAHFEALDVPPLACVAATKLDTTATIVQTRGGCKLRKVSQLGESARDLVFGVASAADGAKVVLTCEPGPSLRMVTSFAKGTMTDVRTLEERGRTMRQVLKLQMKNGSVVTTQQVFTRVAKVS